MLFECSSDALQHLIRRLRLLLNAGHVAADFRDGMNRILRFLHRLLDEHGDLLGALGAVEGELAHLVGHHGKAFAMFTCSCRLDGRIERKQIGFVGDLFDHVGDLVDLFRIDRNVVDQLHHGFHLFHAAAHQIEGLAGFLAGQFGVAGHLGHGSHGLANGHRHLSDGVGLVAGTV